MINIDDFMRVFQQKLEELFEDRIVFLGLQGSYGRNEAKDSSDIDVVVIFNELSDSDLFSYRVMIDSMPEKELICGFVSSVSELMNWQRNDLLSLFLDTKALKGSLSFLEPLFSEQDKREAVLAGGCGIYHAASHNFLHGRDISLLEAIYKSAMFTLRLKLYAENGVYYPSMKEVRANVKGDDKAIASLSFDSFDTASLALINWSSNIIKAFSR